jgi:hypothetical protein
MPSPYEHVMIDIETMSLHRHKALILSVGMVAFDPVYIDRVHIGESQLIVPSIAPQLALGRRISESTQKWWSEQPPEASEHWRTAEVRADLTSTINAVRTFCEGRKYVWANGVQFDLSNLDGLAEDIGQTKELWGYRAPCDMRMFCRLVPATRIMDFEKLCYTGTAHEPVFDCIQQAHHVWEHWQS